MAGDSRERMVRSAAELISTRGVSATSFADVLAASGAPRGSIYHHFPAGKRQLAEDAVRWTSERVLAYQRANAGDTAESVLRCFIGMWRSVVTASSGATGCVVAGVAIDSGGEDAALLPLAAETFREWVTLLAAQLVSTGLTPARAAAIATTTLAGMEGALILCRAEGDVAPLDAVAAELLGLLR
ncbi:TetR family transcriptional regulator [Jatrophihabitans sp.]|uniref:TetR/AcrR family transcriptional regulator n=1 Tax=Jatrophihabitans sp. TaxID=1932789 RepID=UPI0030C72CF6|nr:transcriptional regulator, TetR family [Jatrophihabitans sp.]